MSYEDNDNTDGFKDWTTHLEDELASEKPYSWPVLSDLLLEEYEGEKNMQAPLMDLILAISNSRDLFKLVDALIRSLENLDPWKILAGDREIPFLPCSIIEDAEGNLILEGIGDLNPPERENYRQLRVTEFQIIEDEDDPDQPTVQFYLKDITSPNA